MKATGIGLTAILMWSLLALLTAGTGKVPPLQLLAMTFAIGAGVAIASWPVRGVSLAFIMRVPPRAWLIGVGGLFGYHFLYYTALRNAPIAEASLIAYLWPMLIVLGTAFLPGGGLRWFHVAGSLLGFAGASLLIAGKAGGGGGLALGYASAFGCALVWASYSLLSRLQSDLPTDAVALYCLATAVLAAICHLLLEATVWPETIAQWLSVAGLGLMPVGLAFFAWDHGVKHGDIRLLGICAYFAPLLSTLILVAAGIAPASFRLAAASVLIVGGAMAGSGIWQSRLGAGAAT
jgi:drug/metabolite transporter (DMT)-like permease